MRLPGAAIILQHRLPSRMAELYAFIQMAPALDKLSETTPIQVTAGARTFQISRPTLLLYPIADAAVLMSRGLLQFMGIGMSRKGDLVQAKREPNDIRMDNVDTSLADVPIDRALAGWSISRARAEQLLKLCISTGHKVSAHMTTQTAKGSDADIPELAEAFQLVNDLINREVYKALGEAEIVFSPGTSHGHIV